VFQSAAIKRRKTPIEGNTTVILQEDKEENDVNIDDSKEEEEIVEEIPYEDEDLDVRDMLDLIQEAKVQPKDDKNPYSKVFATMRTKMHVEGAEKRSESAMYKVLSKQ